MPCTGPCCVPWTMPWTLPLAQHEDVVTGFSPRPRRAFTERITEQGHGLQHTVRRVSNSLVGAAPIKGPVPIVDPVALPLVAVDPVALEGWKFVPFVQDHTGLRPQGRRRLVAVDPDVLNVKVVVGHVSSEGVVSPSQGITSPCFRGPSTMIVKSRTSGTFTPNASAIAWWGRV